MTVPDLEVDMKAALGDQIILRGQDNDRPDRDGEVLEVRGADGAPPYLVRWSDGGHIGLLFPGTDAVIHHLGQTVGSS